ncbi:MAG: DUF2007 domain-containing protein [Chitinophagales bacterium]
MNDEWIKVFETTKMHQALMVQSVLKEHHIYSVLFNQQDSLYVVMGEIQVMVRAEDGFDAINIIEAEIT